MIVPEETKTLIEDAVSYLSKKGIDSKDVYTLKTILYSLYITGVEDGINQAREILHK